MTYPSIGTLLILILLPTHASASSSGQLIQLQQDPSFCIAVDSNPSVSSSLYIVKCTSQGYDLRWLFTAPEGNWKLASNPSLCVKTDSVSPGSLLRLTTCSTHQSLLWYYNSNGHSEIENQETTAYCVTYQGSSPSANQAIVLKDRNGGSDQAWTFIQPWTPDPRVCPAGQLYCRAQGCVFPQAPSTNYDCCEELPGYEYLLGCPSGSSCCRPIKYHPDCDWNGGYQWCDAQGCVRPWEPSVGYECCNQLAGYSYLMGCPSGESCCRPDPSSIETMENEGDEGANETDKVQGPPSPAGYPRNPKIMGAVAAAVSAFVYSEFM